MASPRLISVVVSTYNRSDALLSVLQGLAHQTDRHFETIVADDGSRQEHQQPVFTSSAAKTLAATHVWHPDVGFRLARIRNRGVAASRGDYLVFLDGDCVPEVDFVARHRALGAPGFFVSGSRVLLSERLSRRVVGGQEQVHGRSLWYWLSQTLTGQANKLTGAIRLPDWPGRLERGTPWKRVRGCNMAVWRSDFERIEGFDESFEGWGHEDADFFLRLHNAGLARKNGFCATEVFHLWHKEAARSSASHNASVVDARASSRQILPTAGFRQDQAEDAVRITRLG